MYRIGNGIDFHQLVEGRKFILGGVEIPFHKGALGHSDADVLLHAICDALLGALSLGDIGVHFPPNDNNFKDIDSKILLEKCFKLISDKGYKVVNIDSNICLETPKIKNHVVAMQSCIAKILNTEIENISIKATTTETMGAIGRGEGIMAQSVALLQKINN